MRFIPFVLLVLLVAYGDSDSEPDIPNNNNTGNTGTDRGGLLSPPEWILGTWADASNTVSFRFTTNNVLQTLGNTTVDFVNIQEMGTGDVTQLSTSEEAFSFQAEIEGSTQEFDFTMIDETSLTYVFREGGRTVTSELTKE